MKIKILIASPVLLILWLSPVLGFETFGNLSLRAEHYARQPSACPECENWGFLGALDFTIQGWIDSGETFFLYMNPVATIDNLNYTQGVFSDWGTENNYSPYVTLDQGYIEWLPNSDFSVRAGVMTYQWGVSEEINNPTNVNPQDWTDVLGFGDVGIPSVSAVFNLRNMYIEGLFSKHVPSKLPLDRDNRWRPPRLLGIKIDDPDRLNAGQFGLTFGGMWPWADIALTFFDGYSDFPEFSFTGTAQLKQDFFRIRKYGINLATEISSNVFGFEGAFFEQEDPQDDFFQWVLGAQRFMTWDDSTLLVWIQYVRENLVERGAYQFSEFDLRRALKDALTGKIEFERGRWKLGVRGAHDFNDRGWFINPELTRSFDRFDITLGCDILSGPEDSFFGRYEDNSRLFLELKYYF